MVRLLRPRVRSCSQRIPAAHRAAWGIAVAGGLSGCTPDPEPPPDPPLSLADVAPGVQADRWRFEDGAVLSKVSVQPTPLRPGARAEVTYALEGNGRVEFALAGPYEAGRQTVRYGPEGARRVRPDEGFPAGAAWAAGPGGEGRLELEVPDPFPHPHAVLLARYRVGERDLLPARSGPRREDGTVVAAVITVDPVPPRIRVPRTPQPPRTDGRLREPVWDGPGLPMVESRTAAPVAASVPRIHLAWDERALYVGAQIPDGDVWGTYRRRDAPLWKQEAFEVFVGADGTRRRYVELQVSPRCVIYDAAVETYRRGDPGRDLDVDVACRVDGTVDRRSDRDRGWSVEWVLPFRELCRVTDLPCTPAAGTTLRLNAFWIDRPSQGGPRAFALAPTRVPDFHAMDRAAVLELAP